MADRKEDDNKTNVMLSNPISYIPRMMFLTKGKGLHKDYLTSFELALRDAEIADLNLVSVSSIKPPQCKEFLDKKAESI
jgi:arginine decarboxylase